MHEIDWQKHIQQLHGLLSSVHFDDRGGMVVSPDQAFDNWRQRTLDLRQNKGAVYLIGNGASASMASHFAADMAKNARVHTQVFSDLSLITAISNDMGYENVFVEPLRRRANSQDMLIAISSSGKSRNILLAAEFAVSLKMELITLSGMSPDNPLRKLGALNVYVPGQTYGQVETCHTAILHHWMDLLVESC